MRIELDTRDGSPCAVRSWALDDAGSLARYANDRDIWRNLRDGFPFPYSASDALLFLEKALRRNPESFFAIEVEGEAVGSIGYAIQPDVERISAELGYWLGKPFWGRGITTAAVRTVTAHALHTHRLTRIYATPYEHNRASCRVLEKAGFALEARLRRSALKEGRVIDKWLYAYVVEAEESTA